MSDSVDPIVICAYARTPMGSFQGSLAPVKATELGSAAIKAALERAGVAGEQVDKVFMGNVLPAGLGQAPARQAALGAGLPMSAEAVTVNKVCGSGMQAQIFAHDMLKAGSADLIVAGGMESMTNAPYLMVKHRTGARIGHDTVYDSMMLDGLEDAYDSGKAMGVFAEDTARAYQFTREAQDLFAIESLTRAKAAQASGAFDREIVPVEVKERKGVVTRLGRRAARQVRSGQDPDPAPRLRHRRHGDGGDLLLHLGRRGGPGGHPPVGRRQARPAGGGQDRGPRRPRPGAGLVHHRAGAGDPQGAGEGRLERRRRRPVRAQRSLRRRADGGHARPVDPARRAQRERRRLRPGPSDRRVRRADRGHPARGHAGARSQEGVASLCIGGGEATALALETV